MVASINTSGLLNTQPVDIAGAMQKGNTALQSEIKTREMQQEAGDQQVIRDLSSVPGVDFSTPKGIKEFMGHLQGRVSPDTIMRLGDMKTKMEDSENRRVLALAKMGDEERKRYSDTQELVMSAFDGVDKIEDPASRQAEITNRLAKMKEEKTGTGTSVYDAKAIDALGAMPWERQQGIYKGSQHAKDLLARSKDEAQIKRLEELTKATQDGKVENWVTKEGEPLLRHQNGDIYKVNTDTGEPTKLAAMPEGAYKAGTKNPTGAGGVAPQLTDEENKFFAEATAIYGKAIPTPQFGAGAKAQAAKTAYYKGLYALAKERGVSAAQLGDSQIMRDAGKESLRRLTTQNAVTESGEVLVKGLLDKLQTEVDKLGGPDSPKVKQLMNAVYTDWSGEPDFIGIRNIYGDLVEQVGRVYSGSTGAGATPVSFLHLAEGMVPKNPSLAQVVEMKRVIPQLFDARQKATRDVITNLRAGMNVFGKSEEKSSGVDEAAHQRTLKENPPDTPEAAAQKRTDELQILEKERDKTDKELAELRKNPQAKTEDISRLEGDLAGIRRSIARAKGGKSTEETPKKLDDARKEELKKKYGL